MVTSEIREYFHPRFVQILMRGTFYEANFRNYGSTTRSCVVWKETKSRLVVSGLYRSSVVEVDFRNYGFTTCSCVVWKGTKSVLSRLFSLGIQILIISLAFLETFGFWVPLFYVKFERFCNCTLSIVLAL